MRFFPKSSELNQILNNVQCPEEKCCKIFSNTQSLAVHLKKTHGKQSCFQKSSYGSKVGEYYCPEAGCKYCFNPKYDKVSESALFNNRYFTCFKYLKQHYIKVHLNKAYTCEKCNKSFPTDLHRVRHNDSCGKIYRCSCSAKYTSMAALRTHARREQHSICKDTVDKQRSPKSSTVEIKTKDVEKDGTYTIPSSLMIFTETLGVLFLHGNVEFEKQIKEESKPKVSVSVQTEPCTRRRKIQNPIKNKTMKPIKRRSSAQTQTGEKRHKKTAETQTSSQFSSCRDQIISNCSSSNVSAFKHKKTMETQTLNENRIACTEYTFSNKPDHINCFNKNEEESRLANDSCAKDVLIQEVWLNQNKEMDSKNENVSKSSDVSVDTSIISKTSDAFSSFYNCTKDDKSIKEMPSCHIETQTDIAINNIFDKYLTNSDNSIPEDDLLDQYTRWTQTCDDILIPDDISLELTNHETQTAWSLTDDPFISGFVNSETQTPLLKIEDYINLLKNQ